MYQPIPISSLEEAVHRKGSIILAKSFNNALRIHKTTAFLCHSHLDNELAEGLQVFLQENGWDVYIDWKDNTLPRFPAQETALRIKEKIERSEYFIFMATENSRRSRWCPWEIGFADHEKINSKIILIRTSDEDNNWHGNEYLQLYREIAIGDSGRLGINTLQQPTRWNPINNLR